MLDATWPPTTVARAMLGASLTARMAAAYRARASSRPNAICSDPWARLLAGEDQEALLAKGDASMPELELGIALRTAWLDEAVSAFEGPQVVLLNAGLDSRAARLAREGRQFFEVDYPAAQMHKRSAIAVLNGYPKETSLFVPCDFDRADFALALRAAGFDSSLSTLVVWEGMTPYLTEADVEKTFASLAALGVERLLFDTVGMNAAEPLVFMTNDVSPALIAAGFETVIQQTAREAHQAKLGGDSMGPFLDAWRFVDARR